VLTKQPFSIQSEIMLTNAHQMDLNISVTYSKTGLKGIILFWTLSSQETLNKMLMLKGIIGLLGMTGYRNISSKASSKFRSMQRNGYGRTTMTDLTWLSAV